MHNVEIQTPFLASGSHPSRGDTGESKKNENKI